MSDYDSADRLERVSKTSSELFRRRVVTISREDVETEMAEGEQTRVSVLGIWKFVSRCDA